MPHLRARAPCWPFWSWRHLETRCIRLRLVHWLRFACWRLDPHLLRWVATTLAIAAPFISKHPSYAVESPHSDQARYVLGAALWYIRASKQERTHHALVVKVMPNIDDELRQVIDKQEGLVRPEPEPAQAFTRSPAVIATTAKPTRQIGLLIGLIVIGGAILLVVFSGFKQAAVYSKGVDELLREKARFESRTVRVLGTLVSGTLARRSEPCEYRFSMQKNDVAMTVFYPQCVVPDTFRDVSGVKVEVTAEGQLQKDGTFRATQIMAKCPSKYEMQGKANQQGQAPSHALVVDPGVIKPGVDSR